MKTIVVGVDGSGHSARALDRATEMARASGARVLAVNVVMPPYVPPEPYGIATGALEASLREHGETLVKDAVQRVQKSGVSADGQIGIGNPAAILCEMAEAAGAEMVVVGSRGVGAFHRVLLGSVSDRLAHTLRVPLLIVP